MGYSSNACPRTHLNILLGSNHSDPKHISYYSHYFLYFRQQKNLGKVSPSLWVLTFHPSWPLNSQRVPCLVTKRSVYASCCCTGNCCSTTAAAAAVQGTAAQQWTVPKVSLCTTCSLSRLSCSSLALTSFQAECLPPISAFIVKSGGIKRHLSLWSFELICREDTLTCVHCPTKACSAHMTIHR